MAEDTTPPAATPKPDPAPEESGAGYGNNAGPQGDAPVPHADDSDGD